MNYEVVRAFIKTKANWLIYFTWAFAEGILFFIIPDIYVGFAAMFGFQYGLIAVAASVAGSLLSAVVVFSLGQVLLLKLSELISHLPGISDLMIQNAVDDLHNRGLLSLIDAPLSGIPYKIYSVHAALEHYPLWQYLLWSIPSRLERVLPIALFMGLVGYIFRNTIKKNTKIWIFGYVIAWIGIYVFYYARVG